MATFSAKLTADGFALYTQAIVSGIPVQLTAMAVGDGGGNPTTPVESQKRLVREVFRSNLSSLSKSPTDQTALFAELIVPPSAGGFSIREVGLYTADGTLFAVANFPTTYKPSASEGSTSDLVIKFGLKLANASAVTLVIDASIVGATRAWVLSTITLALLAPGGTTNQVLRKKSNRDGDAEWADPTASLNIVVDTIRETQYSAAGQQTYTLTKCTTVGLAIYVAGLRQSTFTVVDGKTIKLVAPIAQSGVEVLFVQNAPAEPINLRRMSRGVAYFLGHL